MSIFGDIAKAAGGFISGTITGGPLGGIAGAVGAVAGGGRGKGGRNRRAAGNRGITPNMRNALAKHRAGMPITPQNRAALVRAGLIRPGGGADITPRAGRGFQATPPPQQVPRTRKRPRINLPGVAPAGVGIQVGGTRLGFGETDPILIGEPQTALPFFGQVAVEPDREERTVRVCPPGFRLAIDGKCYHKAMLGKRSKLRAWPAGRAPLVSGEDARILGRIDSIQNKIKGANKKAGLRVPSRKKK